MEEYPLVRLLIPIIAIVMGCGIPLLSIYLDYRKRREIFSLHHHERMAAIEKGLELPPLPRELLIDKEAREKAGSPHSDLGWGLFWLLGGAALLAALYFNSSPSTSLYALIPIAIGVHYLIYYLTVGKKEALAVETEHRTKTARSGAS
jgi:hypothetical protein